VKTPTVAQALAEARRGVPLNEARLLLQHAVGCTHAQLAAHPERVLSRPQAGTHMEYLQRRAAGEPVAYILGCREFYGRSFRVTPDVLIPRPETELLVELALERIRDRPSARILDLGTGSGVLALTLALELPQAQVTATDASAAALAVARTNAQRFGARACFVHGHWLSAVRGERFDLIVSNPPYVAAGDPHLALGDPRFEPRAALCDGSADGLDSIHEIVALAPGHLAPGGWLLFEQGYEQAEPCRELLSATGFADIGSWRDLAGIERVSGGRVPGTSP
jgi:release factor glutamine methyltransferase